MSEGVEGKRLALIKLLCVCLLAARPLLCAVVCICVCCSYERVAEGEARVIVVVNAARGNWQGGEYGLWVGGGGSFKQVYCSQVRLSATYIILAEQQA
jgi:hypothetical protein